MGSKFPVSRSPIELRCSSDDTLLQGLNLYSAAFAHLSVSNVKCRMLIRRDKVRDFFLLFALARFLSPPATSPFLPDSIGLRFRLFPPPPFPLPGLFPVGGNLLKSSKKKRRKRGILGGGAMTRPLSGFDSAARRERDRGTGCRGLIKAHHHTEVRTEF